MGATYTRGFPNPIVWPLRSCSQLKSHPATYARGVIYTRVITVGWSPNSLVPGRPGGNFKVTIFKLIM